MISLASYFTGKPSDINDTAKDASETPPSHLRHIIKNYMSDVLTSTMEPSWPLVEGDDQPYMEVTSTQPLQGELHECAPNDDAAAVQPSLLPQVIYDASTNVSAAGESLFDRFTYYKELRDAQTDSDYERTLERLLKEWWAVGASVSATA